MPATHSRRDAQDVYTELYQTLASHHPGQHHDRMAQALTRVDRERDLVALLEDAEQAAIYHPLENRLTAHAVSKHGLDDPGEVLWERTSDPAAWIDAHPERVVWVHPRYRWVLDLPDDHHSWSYSASRDGVRVHSQPATGQSEA